MKLPLRVVQIAPDVERVKAIIAGRSLQERPAATRVDARSLQSGQSRTPVHAQPLEVSHLSHRYPRGREQARDTLHDELSGEAGWPRGLPARAIRFAARRHCYAALRDWNPLATAPSASASASWRTGAPTSSPKIAALAWCFRTTPCSRTSTLPATSVSGSTTGVARTRCARAGGAGTGAPAR